MKKTLFAIIAVAAMAVTQVQALTVTVDRVSGYWAGSGGEFNVSPITGNGYAASDLYNNSSGAAGFGTFCLDRNTGITVPGTYTATVSLGTSATGSTISMGTSWLFSQFAGGTLSGYLYSQTSGGTASGRAGSAYNLQLAIWTLQGTYSYVNPASNPFLAQVISAFGSMAAAEANAAPGANNVGVLNLYNSNGSLAQPMLTLLPDGGSALMLLGMGLSSMALIARKFRS